MEKIKDNTKNGKCSRCGKCCANILFLTSSEILRIQKYIKTHNIQPINRNSALLSSSDNYVNCCPFLSKENLCLIYNVRPKICEEFSCGYYCDLRTDMGIDYRHIKAVNMLKTFFPNEYCPCDDQELNLLNKKIKNLQKSFSNKKI